MTTLSCERTDIDTTSVASLGGLESLRSLMGAARMVDRGRILFRDDDACEFIYFIRSGTFKQVLGLSDGREQICGFRMAGELLGLEGMGGGHYASSAVCLENAGVCAISRVALAEHFTDRSLLASFNGHMSAELKRHSDLILMLGSLSAQGRLAEFLIGLSDRLKAMGYSSTEFHLRMSRAEIGSYLGMSLETVSRTLTAFQVLHLLSVHNRHVKSVDLEGLRHVVEAG